MITGNESVLIKTVLDMCEDKGACLLSADTLAAIIGKKKLTAQKIRVILNALELEDYWDIIKCDKNGEEVLCITLHKKARAYKLERKLMWRSVIFKICLALVGSAVAFIFTKILANLFR